MTFSPYLQVVALAMGPAQTSLHTTADTHHSHPSLTHTSEHSEAPNLVLLAGTSGSSRHGCMEIGLPPEATLPIARPGARVTGDGSCDPSNLDSCGAPTAMPWQASEHPKQGMTQMPWHLHHINYGRGSTVCLDFLPRNSHQLDLPSRKATAMLVVYNNHARHVTCIISFHTLR
jgi:hypothetical protein